MIHTLSCFMNLCTYIRTCKRSEVYGDHELVRHELIRELAHDLVHKLVNHEVTLRFMRLIIFYKIN